MKDKMDETFPRGRLSRRESIDLPPFVEGADMCESLQCSICLDVLTDPVTIPCGHNFCRGCLETCWDCSQDCSCPECKETFTYRPDLKVNVVLKALVQNNTTDVSDACGLLDELMCSICLEVFDNPVTTPCGHNFCDSCLRMCWVFSQDCSCPFCKETFSQRPELRSNTVLREIVQLYEKSTGYKRETAEQEESLLKESQHFVCPDVFNNPVTGTFYETCPREFWEISCGENVSETSDLKEFVLPQSEMMMYVGPETKPTPPEILTTNQVLKNELVEKIDHNVSKKHEGNLENFSKHDQTSVYLFCAGDHKCPSAGFSEERTEKMTQRVTSHTDLQQIIHNIIKKREGVKTPVKLSNMPQRWVTPTVRLPTHPPSLWLLNAAIFHT